MSSIFVDRKWQRADAGLFIPPEARTLMNRIVDRLSLLDRRAFDSPLEEPFRKIFNEVVTLVERHQMMVIERSEYGISCTRGCVHCCNHWVEDVNSFEAEIIADYIRCRFPERVDDIRQCCEADGGELERLEKLATIKLQEQNRCSSDDAIDSVDLLLSLFYQMRRPCPLLSDDGSCSIYEVRPLTCRIYVSFSDPLRCNPDYIDSSLTPTCLMDLSETANQLLDTLHFRYLRFEGDTGLRSLVGKHLSDNHI